MLLCRGESGEDMERIRILRVAAVVLAVGIIGGVLTVWYCNNIDWQALWFRQCIIFAWLAGLMLMFSFLFQLLSMSKWGIVRELIPGAILFRLHRILGFSTAGLLALHLGLLIPGKTAEHHISVSRFLASVLWDGGVARSTASGLALLLIVWGFSFLMVKKMIGMKFWKATHLLTYPAFLLVLIHQIAWGNDFQDFRWLTVGWSALLFGGWCIAIAGNLRAMYQKRSGR